MAEEKKVSTPKKPKELEQPKGQNEITVDFINRYFRYQENLARYNYKIDNTDENKAKIDEAKKVHKDWIDFVYDTYKGKVDKQKTDTIIKAFIKKYYPNLPEKAVKGNFK